MAFKKFRKMKVYEASGYNYKRTPSIILKGDWLKETGFDVGGLIQVECENGKLIITPREPEMVEHLMDAETWMDANKAVELGFADDIMARAKTGLEEDGGGDTDGEDGEEKKSPSAHSSMLFSRRAADNALLNKVIAKYREKKPRAGIGEQAKIPAPGEKGTPKTETGRSVDALMERLNLLKR